MNRTMSINSGIEFDAEVNDGIIKVPDVILPKISHHVHVSLQPKDTRQYKVSKYIPTPVKNDSLIIPSRDELR